MNKKIKAALLASTALLGSISVAHSQLTISGYTELSYISGGYKQAGGATGAQTTTPTGGTGTALTTTNDIQKQVGSEVSLRFTNKHNLSGPMAGYYAQAMAEIRRIGNGFEEQSVTFGPTNNAFVLFIEKDVVRGIEHARNVYPTVNNRVGDIIGAGTGVVDPLDASSTIGNFGVAIPNLGGGMFSINFAPNMGGSVNTATNNSDGNANKGTVITEGQKRYSVGYRNSNIKLAGGTVDIGVGYLGGTQPKANFIDPKSRTLGVTYRTGPFAAGIQRFRNENPAAVSGNSDTQLTYGITFAATKEISIGAAMTRQEGQQAGVKDPDDITAKTFQAAYNMGPAVFQLDYQLVSNANYVSGQDMAPVKAKFKVNF